MIMSDMRNRYEKLPHMRTILDKMPSEQELRDIYEAIGGDFGLVWDVPSLGSVSSLGLLVVPVREGMLCIPYYEKSYENGVSNIDYDVAYIGTEEDFRSLTNDFKSYADSFAEEVTEGMIIAANNQTNKDQMEPEKMSESRKSFLYELGVMFYHAVLAKNRNSYVGRTARYDIFGNFKSILNNSSVTIAEWDTMRDGFMAEENNCQTLGRSDSQTFENCKNALIGEQLSYRSEAQDTRDNTDNIHKNGRF